DRSIEMARDRQSSTSADRTAAFERGAVVVSIDTERIWGYLDCLTETQFEHRFPHAAEAHDLLLERLCATGVSATWFVVGGLALGGEAGLRAQRFAGSVRGVNLPAGWQKSTPLWHSRAFLERLRDSWPAQEIGLHGGLTHLIWKDARATREMARRELSEGIHALERL